MPAKGRTVSLRSEPVDAPASTNDAPQKRPGPSTERPDGPAGTPPSSRRRFLRWGLFLLLVLIGGGYWYVTGGSVMSTDNAYVEADKVGISTDVSGIVKDVEVTENQRVTAGQILFRLDDLPFRLALQRAEAQVDIVRDSLKALQANYRDMQTQIKRAQDDVDYFNTEFHRQQGLLNQHVASQAAFDAARRNLQNAQQKLASLIQQLGAITANLNGAPDGPVEQQPRYREAVAQRDEA